MTGARDDDDLVAEQRPGQAAAGELLGDPLHVRADQIDVAKRCRE
jgi:hypothetical protein